MVIPLMIGLIEMVVLGFDKGFFSKVAQKFLVVWVPTLLSKIDFIHSGLVVKKSVLSMQLPVF